MLRPFRVTNPEIEKSMVLVEFLASNGVRFVPIPVQSDDEYYEAVNVMMNIHGEIVCKKVGAV